MFGSEGLLSQQATDLRWFFWGDVFLQSATNHHVREWGYDFHSPPVTPKVLEGEGEYEVSH